MPPDRTTVEEAIAAWDRRTSGEGSAFPLLLAVSGGLDSIVLLDAMARVAPSRIAAVASFDHDTGPAARRAVAHVVREAGARGIPVVTGLASQPAAGKATGEAAWRAARWRFLREALRDLAHAEADSGTAAAPRIPPAHTRDDQVETVFLRALRGAGARGLAGLRAASAIERPLLAVSRAEVEEHAHRRALAWVDDPSNRDLRFLRNRVRHEILPALRAMHASLDGELLAIGERAAAWREAMDALAMRAAPSLELARAGRAIVAAADLAGYDSGGLAVLWGAIAWRAGLALDRRGTKRLVEFTMDRRGDAVAHLAGGWEVARMGARVELRRAVVHPEGDVALPRVGGDVRWGRFRFSAATSGVTGDDPWTVVLPDEPLAVRGWRPGDRIAGRGGVPRRVKRFLREAGIRGADRTGWPVVVAAEGQQILWIPGVRRSDAATVRSGRPALIVRCERTR